MKFLLVMFSVMGLASGGSAANETQSRPQSMKERLLMPDMGRQSRFEEMTFQAQPGLSMKTFDTQKEYGRHMVKPEEVLGGGKSGFQTSSPTAESGRKAEGFSGQAGIKTTGHPWSSRSGVTAPVSPFSGQRYEAAERSAPGLERSEFAGAKKASPMSGKMYAGPEADKVSSDLALIHESLSKAKPEDLPGHTLSIGEIREILNRN